MGKLIEILSVFALGLLLILSTVSPDAPAIWLAATTSEYYFIRVPLMIILLVLLFTHPPRNIYFRQFVTIAAIIVGGWSLTATYQNKMMFLDSLSILAASISMLLAVLEYEPQRQEKSVRRRIIVHTG